MSNTPMKTLSLTVLGALALGAGLAVLTDNRGEAALAAPNKDGIEWPENTVVGTATNMAFPAGSMIIPVDGCYQKNASFDKTNHTAVLYDGASSNDLKCSGEGNGNKDCGIVEAYGVAVRLMRAGIPIHWVINPAKTSVHAIDFSIVGNAPVVDYSVKKSGGGASNRYASLSKIDYRGAPFVIDAAYANRVDALLSQMATDTKGIFTRLDFHVANYAFTAPVYSTMTAPPKLAILDIDNDLKNGKTYKVRQYTVDAQFEAAGSWWSIVTTAELKNDRLTKEKFSLLWLPSFEWKVLTGPTTAIEIAVADKVKAFLDAGGSVVVFDAAITSLTGYGIYAAGFYTQVQAAVTQFAGKILTEAGLIRNGVSDIAWNRGATGEWNLVQEASDPMSQMGGLFWTGVSGTTYAFKDRSQPQISAPGQEKPYLAGTHLATYAWHATDANKRNWSFAGWRDYDDGTKGRMFFVGGDGFSCSNPSGLRILMNSTFMEAVVVPSDPPQPPIELSRSTAITTVLEGETIQLVGTKDVIFPEPKKSSYEGGAATGFQFPQVTGHFRGIDVTNIQTGAGSNFADLPELFDTNLLIPAANATGCGTNFTSSCRTVFTNVVTGKNPPKVFFTQNNKAQFKAHLAPTFNDTDTNTLVARVLAGIPDGATWKSSLGGVDRSTAAVVSADSPNVLTQRPQMAYVGALDGMLHAICLEAKGACDQAGRELWAFIPRTKLYSLRFNEAYVDGSPRIADVFSDFDTDGDKEWKTVLIFQTGSGDAFSPLTYPSVIALDVTDPTAPNILWEKSTGTTDTDEAGNAERALYEQGIGLTLASGMARVPGIGLEHVTYIVTNNGGDKTKAVVTGTSRGATYLIAVVSATGQVVWQKVIPHQSTTPPPPEEGIPGGVSVSSTNGDAILDIVLVPTLGGELWGLDPSTGDNLYGTAPLFRFSNAYHPIGAPPAVYRARGSGELHAVVVSGGYADASLTVWSPSTEEQYVVSIPLKPADGVALPVDETTVANAGGFTISLGLGNRAFAQAVVAGNELFVVTDVEDVNESGYTASGSGKLRRLSLGDGSSYTQVSEQQISGGAASVDYESGSVYATGGSKAQKVELANFDSEGGGSAEVSQQETKSGRKLWLQIQ